MKLTPESTFKNVHMPGYITTIKAINEAENTLSVFIRKKDAEAGFMDHNWNLQHTLWAFERGEYFDLKQPDK